MRRVCLASLLAIVLLAFNGCEWDKQLPFKGNDVDPSLLGFWWKVLTPSDSAGCRLVTSQALIQYRRDGDYYFEVLWYCPPDGDGSVVEYNKRMVFTKSGMKYEIRAGDKGFTHWLASVPYEINGDTLRINSERYVRVIDTSKLEWAVRRGMGRKP